MQESQNGAATDRINSIFSGVAGRFNCRISDIAGEQLLQTQEVVRPRRVAMHLVKRMIKTMNGNLSNREVAVFFGCNPSTISSNRTELMTDPELLAVVLEIGQSIDPTFTVGENGMGIRAVEPAQQLVARGTVDRKAEPTRPSANVPLTEWNRAKLDRILILLSRYNDNVALDRIKSADPMANDENTRKSDIWAKKAMIYIASRLAFKSDDLAGYFGIDCDEMHQKFQKIVQELGTTKNPLKAALLERYLEYAKETVAKRKSSPQEAALSTCSYGASLAIVQPLTL
jgi:hypothetical protein